MELSGIACGIASSCHSDTDDGIVIPTLTMTSLTGRYDTRNVLPSSPPVSKQRKKTVKWDQRETLRSYLMLRLHCSRIAQGPISSHTRRNDVKIHYNSEPRENS